VDQISCSGLSGAFELGIDSSIELTLWMPQRIWPRFRLIDKSLLLAARARFQWIWADVDCIYKKLRFFLKNRVLIRIGAPIYFGEQQQQQHQQ